VLFPRLREKALMLNASMLDFCAEHNIVSDIELIPIQKINEAYARMLKSDVNTAL
jgi:D-arabinose 1-dehydrogenase-like Zn-dependent alcohol dehydrogenase